MKIDEFTSRLSKALSELNLSGFHIVRRGFSYVKIRIKVDPDTLIEIYFNDQTQSLTSALLVDNKRVFGIDGYPIENIWHMHPVGKVNRHVNIEPVEIEQIIKHYGDALTSLGYKW